VHPDAKALIERLGMIPIPVEGGWYRQTWRSPEILPGGSVVGLAADAPVGTAILALFCDDPWGFSALHRLAATEVWHFCGGDPFHLLLLHGDGRSEDVVLGPDLATGHEVQQVVASGTWMGGAVAPGGRLSLLGCTMAPGFTDEGLECGERAALIAAFPDRAADITRLTRPERQTA
jgi:predicted cupin superfamily sugar epimerase